MLQKLFYFILFILPTRVQSMPMSWHWPRPAPHIHITTTFWCCFYCSKLSSTPSCTRKWGKKGGHASRRQQPCREKLLISLLVAHNNNYLEARWKIDICYIYKFTTESFCKVGTRDSLNPVGLCDGNLWRIFFMIMIKTLRRPRPPAFLRHDGMFSIGHSAINYFFDGKLFVMIIKAGVPPPS